MGYDAGKLDLCGQAIAGPKSWVYEDTGGEAVSAYQASGYFANAKVRGCVAGDPIKVVDRSADVVWTGYFTEVQDTGATTGTVRFDTGQP